MATVFERLRTIALAAQTSSKNHDNYLLLNIDRSHSLFLPEKTNRYTTASCDIDELQQWVENEELRRYENSLSKRDTNRNLTNSNQDDGVARQGIVKNQRLSRFDKSFIKTVDDSVVNTRSHGASLCWAGLCENIMTCQEGPENLFRLTSDTSFEDPIPPSSTQLGIGPAPCLNSPLSDDERIDWEREAQPKVTIYLPSSTRSAEHRRDQETNSRACRARSAISLSGSFIISRHDQLDICEPHGLEEVSSPGSSAMDLSDRDCKPIKKQRLPHTQPLTPITFRRSINRAEREAKESLFLPCGIKKGWSDDKLDTPGWSESEAIYFGEQKRSSIKNSLDSQDINALHKSSNECSSLIKRSAQNTCPNTPFLTMPLSQTPKIEVCSEEVFPLALEPITTEEYPKSALSESSFMVSLFDNQNWVKAEDLCPINSLGSLGRGAGGKITGVFHIPTCNIFAVKATSDYSEIDHFVLLKEALKDRRTPQLMTLFGLFGDKDSNDMVLVLKYMDLGSLHDHFICKGKRCTERQVRYIARETLLGLQEIHSLEKPIIHRDIKPHNILIESVGSVLVADYGLLYRLRDAGQLCTEMAGTTKYFSPERHNGKFSMASDIWALGVTLLECLLGKLLDAEDLEGVKINGGQVHPLNFYNPAEIRFSADALNFLQCCLQINPKKRWNASMLLKHQFLKPPYPNPTGIFVPKRRLESNEMLLKEILEIIQTFIRRNLESKVSQKDIWANAKGITHETRMSNIVRWTGFSKLEIQEHVNKLYLERTNPRSGIRF